MGKAKERLDKIMAACQEHIQEEVSALLGKTMKISEPETAVISKEDFFSEPAPKSVLAHVQLEGDIPGHGCLIVSVCDAIRIGGTLIMLPDSELNKVVSEEEYSEELEDSYGEIANIICGAITATLEEQYPKNLRLVKTGQEVIVPVKVVVESDEPVPDGSYYMMRASMELEGVEMGVLQLLLPAENLGLIELSAPTAEEQKDTEKAVGMDGDGDDSQSISPEKVNVGTVERETVAAPERAKALDRDQEVKEKNTVTEATELSVEKLEKQKQKIAQILDVCLGKIGEEVGALLGGTLKIEGWDNWIYSKEEFLEQAGGKQVMARMEVRGDQDTEAYIIVSLKDAVFLGGTLIMLPDAELEEVVRNEEFGADVEDAYGEITNIIAGVYTAVFEEQYQDSIGFAKTGIETIIPVKIDPGSDDVIPDEFYFLSAGELVFNEQKLGRIQAVFPVRIFGLEALARQADADGSFETETENVISRQATGSGGDGGSLEGSGYGENVDVLIFTDDEIESASLAELLNKQGYRSKVLNYRDQVSNHLTRAVGLVFLVMKDVDEQGFGMAIKLSNNGLRVPLVAAGPSWTRTTVLKAVKYGVSDILITPAADIDIQEKVNTNMVSKAA